MKLTNIQVDCNGLNNVQLFDNIGQVVNYCDSKKSTLTFVSYNAIWIGISRLRRSSFTMEIEFSNSNLIVPIIDPTPSTSTTTLTTSTTTTSTTTIATTTTTATTTIETTTLIHEIDPTPPLVTTTPIVTTYPIYTTNPIMTTTPIITSTPNNNSILCGVQAIKPDETGLKIVGGSIAVPHRSLDSINHYIIYSKSKFLFKLALASWSSQI